MLFTSNMLDYGSFEPQCHPNYCLATLSVRLLYFWISSGAVALKSAVQWQNEEMVRVPLLSQISSVVQLAVEHNGIAKKYQAELGLLNQKHRWPKLWSFS